MLHHRRQLCQRGCSFKRGRSAQHACASVGVIWRGDSLIDGVPETLDALRAMVISLLTHLQTSLVLLEQLHMRSGVLHLR